MYVVGKVLKPQGRRGEIKVEIITSFPGHFRTLKKVFTEDANGWFEFKVDHVRLTGKFVFIKLAGLNSIDGAEKLRGEYLYISGEDLNVISENEYYVHDLIGMQVFDENETLLGEIADVESPPANDLYILKSLNGKTFSIPAIKDVVKHVDVQKKKMTIHLMDGLFD